MKCDMDCFECKFDDCVNNDAPSKLESYINARNEKETKGYKVDMKTRKQLWYIKNKEKVKKMSKEYRDKQRKYRIENKLCVLCGEKLVSDYEYKNCPKCRKRIVEYNHKHKEKENKRR